MEVSTGLQTVKGDEQSHNIRCVGWRPGSVHTRSTPKQSPHFAVQGVCPREAL